MTPRTLYRALAIAEAATWTLLIVGMLLKYVVRVTDVVVSIGGAVHGFTFLAFVATALVLAVNQRWSLRVTALAVLSAVVPYLSIPVERWLVRHSRLDGDWRRVATDDPRDRHVESRMLRWALAHTGLFVGVVAVAVAAVFVALLAVGPPQLPSPVE
jgi:integral membrane protein